MGEALSLTPLVARLQQRVQEGIVSGDLEPGSRLNESRLAEEVQVSRTPLREALQRLVGAGLIASQPRKGFFVPPLSRSEAEDLYHLVGLIESAAFEHAGETEAVAVEQLRSISERRRRAREDPRLSFRLDQKWHSALLAGVRNELLLEQLRLLKHRLLRYELAFQYSSERVAEALDDHRMIEDALDEGRSGEVPALLRRHWEHGLQMARRSEVFSDGADGSDSP